MSFPHIDIKTTHILLTDELADLVTVKYESLDKFLPEDETDVTCDVELEKTTEQQNGRIFRAEINLKVAGRLFRAEATEEQIEHAIDVTRDELKRELTKAKGKEKSLIKKGGQVIKNMMRRN